MAYETERLSLEIQKVDQLKRIADSLRHLEEFVGGGFVFRNGRHAPVAWVVGPKSS